MNPMSDYPENAIIDELDHVLNLIRYHCKENSIPGAQAAKIFELGMAAMEDAAMDK